MILTLILSLQHELDSYISEKGKTSLNFLRNLPEINEVNEDCKTIPTISNPSYLQKHLPISQQEEDHVWISDRLQISLFSELD